MAPFFGNGTFGLGEQKPPERRVKEWSPIDRMLAEKGSKRRSKTDLPPLCPAPPPPVTTAEIQVQSESWEVLLKEPIREAVTAALAPEQQKYKALQAEIQAMQQQLNEKDYELETHENEIKNYKKEIESHKRGAFEQYLEQKKSLDDLKSSVEKERLQWIQERESLEASQNLLRAELQLAKTEASDERWRKEEQSESWEVLLKERIREAVAAALAPEQEKYEALQAEIQAMQQQLNEKDYELETRENEIESYKKELDSYKRRASEAACEAASAHAAEQAQYLEEKKSLDDFKRSVEKQRLQWIQERESLEASQNLLRAELQSAKTEASDERWQKEELEKDLSSQLAAARKARAECREDMESVQDQLRRSQDDMKSLRRQMAALKEEHAAVAQERDDLLQRLEDEQAEMILRVAAVEEQLSKRRR